MAGHRDITLSVENMSCVGCVARADRALAALPGVPEASVNLAAATATVTCPGGEITPAETGYPAPLAGADMDRKSGGRTRIVRRSSKESFDEYR